MKFLCVKCDTVMGFAERQLPGDGTMAAVFTCGACQNEVAMLTNPMETQFVAGLGIKIGGRTVPEQPFELIRTQTATGGEVFEDVMPRVSVRWSEDAVQRLEKVPSFVRGMVKRIYTDYARERSIPVIDEAVMDRARVELGLEGM